MSSFKIDKYMPLKGAALHIEDSASATLIRCPVNFATVSELSEPGKEVHAAIVGDSEGVTQLYPVAFVEMTDKSYSPDPFLVIIGSKDPLANSSVLEPQVTKVLEFLDNIGQLQYVSNASGAEVLVESLKIRKAFKPHELN